MEYETNPVKAIRKACLDCCCGSAEEVKQCTIERCNLFPYRFGKNPFRTKKNLSEEQRTALATRLAESRKNKGKKE